MPTAISTLNRNPWDALGVTITGPVAGLYTFTAPATISQADLDSWIAGAVAEATAAANADALLAKANAALNANATFLAIPAPTQAQGLAQIVALTKEINVLIKLRVSDLANTTGT